jgi:hypothetical protein
LDARSDEVEAEKSPSFEETIHLHKAGPDTREDLPPPGSQVKDLTEDEKSRGLMEAAGINPDGGGM